FDTRAGYYTDSQELTGQFHGRVAARLKLSGPATKEVFHALCRNINPLTGGPLTARTMGNRTVYYDINFHCPKSVTIAYLIYGDDRILSLFQAAVNATMQEIEQDTQARVRKNGQNDNRTTGELLWSDFVHLTSRPVDDDTAPDPHLHSHCPTFNVTWDETDQMYKAGMFRDIKRDMPYYQARYHKRLADGLMGLGYSVRRTVAGFELEGVNQQEIDLFSKRTTEINRIAKDKNITDAAQLDQLGAQTRAKKKKDISLAELKADWKRQIADLDIQDTRSGDSSVVSVSAQECIDFALLHCFERSSVAHDRRILAAAYRHGLGCGVVLDDISQAFHRDKRIIRIQDGLKLMCTTHEVLAEEKRMVSLAIAGKGQCVPLYVALPSLTATGEQAAAITHVLTTTDRVSNVQGGAGTGKTTLLKELVSHVRDTGIDPVMVAPTANGSRGVMREEGFTEADTVARLLIDSEMQAKLPGGMLIVDEAGLLGVQDMAALLQIATDRNARLLLFGDTRQHASVIRGDALRILNTVAGIKAAEVNKIYRQRHEVYRKAVEDLAAGQIHSAFQRLDSFGAITEMEPEELTARLVNDYMEAVEKGKSALVVSPTHLQGEMVTAELRLALRQAGRIGPDDTLATRYINLNYTDAEKADPRMFQPGHAVQFNQNLKGITRGSIWRVRKVAGDIVTIAQDNKTMPLALDKAAQFAVYRETQIPVTIGDAITITRGSFDQNGKRLNNGQSLQISGIDSSNNLTLISPASGARFQIGSSFGHLNHGYTSTSHASQGKTVDEVFISQPAGTFAASSMKQFYVSVSRARDRVHIYTDDKAGLLEQVTAIGDRQSAIELTSAESVSQFMARQERQPEYILPKMITPKPGTLPHQPRKQSHAKPVPR
ncbi:MAG: relaxase domain-containing protein, partial [Bacteroidetes bacterium]|nr:relaxase domain-containing protein [Bacteroidota bacterium]